MLFGPRTTNSSGFIVPIYSFFPHHFLDSEPGNKHAHKEFGHIFLSMSFSRHGSEAICTLYIYDREGVAVAVAA